MLQFKMLDFTGRTAATLKQAEKVNLGRDNVSGLKSG